ncbi:iron transporter FeoB [Methanosarcina sp. 2.H.T.1A.6]|uniref:ferrous iron transport protein B n=1 Tax=unclassified Methanosarcina TaxID=2644672 RepID=UPI000621665C|nr:MULTISPECIES: ferrous iron transport protein B [unclassified Methanosarcina]KKG14856.1 iron transporter FeoB [Methanosarcina sp. 2.H.T.1A.15]KKG19021.1 iron transporter FeoB [Methanosarcina sp. 2.H.T.1A.3]KKG20829.1 iron transporter FeoB [Methanosarcina sp. 2.H.T.1A.6]KKG22226.1 iron transporter FeoB [Methanosarcina sp. 2.H.T.1A.8]
MKLPLICPEKECCRGKKECMPGKGLPKIVLVGSPNVGKSSLFNALSGSYTVVSNYPGTSVEVSRGKSRIGDLEYEIIDTPGMYSLLPVSEEERVSQRLLFDEKTFVCLHVVDARNLRRMLSFTLQLLEARLPLILVLNMMDEAEERGIEIDIQRLSLSLGIPVVGTVSSEGKGIEELKASIMKYSHEKLTQEKTTPEIDYGPEVEPYISKIEGLLETVEETGISKRSLALLLLQGDRTALDFVYSPGEVYRHKIEKCEAGKNDFEELQNEQFQKLAETASVKAGVPLSYLFTLKRQEPVNEIVEQVMGVQGKEKEAAKETKNEKKKRETKKVFLAENIDSVLTHPLLGIPVLLLVLYFGLYRFVGVFAAGTLVDLLENRLFGEYINPLVTTWFTSLVPYPALQDLFVGEYGIFTQAVTYAIALILPIVGAFFLVFSIIEDTGYLPRLGLLLDGMFKKIGLSGRAVIPMVLGFGCSTMATMVTRTLETKRERLISTILLALAIPCSAQLGIILSVLSGNPNGLIVWAGVIVLEFAFIGYLAARILPGEAPTFILEMPPLRIPRLSNIAVKTYSRMHWYFLEVLPLFVLASVLIWIGRLTGLFALALKAMEYPTVWIGLPSDAADIFLFGFFRRDFGAAGLYGMHDAGLLTGVQLVVAAVTLTLFMPCIAQFMMTIKERGFKMALAISGFIFPSAFLAGFIVNTLLTALGVKL